MNPTLLNATSAFLTVAIDVLLRDAYYRDLLAKIQAEGRDGPTAEELAEARSRVRATLASLDATIAAKEAGK